VSYHQCEETETIPEGPAAKTTSFTGRNSTIKPQIVVQQIAVETLSCQPARGQTGNKVRGSPHSGIHPMSVLNVIEIIVIAVISQNASTMERKLQESVDGHHSTS